MDRIVTSTPISKSAATVTSRGYSYTPTINNCPETIWDENPLIDLPTLPRDSHITNIRNLRRGNLVIIGYWRSVKGRGSQWIARCDCGRHVARYGKAFRTKLPEQWDGCPYCQKERRVVEGYREREHMTFKEFFGIKE